MRILRCAVAALTIAIASGSALAAETIYIPQAVPFAEDAGVDKAIVDECKDLGPELLTTLESAAKENGLTVERNDAAVKAGKGKALVVEITNAVSGGNAFIGHSKSVSVRGRLMENGKLVAKFTGSRASMGGMFGGYKSSCSVLGRCTATLGEDIAKWLKAPTDGARLGE